MSGLTLPLRTAILRHVFRGEAMPEPPTALYAAAFTALGEVSAADTGYARVRITPEAWSEPDEQGVVTNAAWIDFAPVRRGGAPYGQVVAVELFDAAAGGTSWARGVLPAPTVIIAGDQLRIEPGALTIALRERSQEAAS